MGGRGGLAHGVIAVLVPVLLAGSAASNASPVPDRPPETKDRLAPEAMERIAARPLKAARARGLSAGDAVLSAMIEDIRRKGDTKASRVRIADALTAYGVGLYIAGSGEEEAAGADWQRASLAYLERAIHAYETALGPDDPEVAVALHSYADVLLELAEGEPPPEAIASLERAHRIRLAALGADDRETLATRFKLVALTTPITADRAAFATMLSGISGETAQLQGNPRALEWLPGAYLRVASRFLDAGLAREAFRIRDQLMHGLIPLTIDQPDLCGDILLAELTWMQALEDAGIDQAMIEAETDPMIQPFMMRCAGLLASDLTEP